MSYHYNEAFENPDYHYSETLEIDRREGVSQGSTSFHQNPYDSSPYDSYEDRSGGVGRQLNVPVAIPMDSMLSNSEYSPRAPRSAIPDMNPYGNAHVNPSFEYDSEFPFILQSASNAVDGPYVRGPSDMPNGAGFIQRRPRREADMVFMTPFSLQRMDPGYDDEKLKQEEKLIQNLVSMSSGERTKAIQRMPKIMKEKREIRNKVLVEKTKKSVSKDAQIYCCTQCLYTISLSFRHFKNSLVDSFQLLQPWQKTLKTIGGKFGTNVLSYFVFLTWLLTFNAFSFLVNFSFITIPQLIASKPNNLSFTGLELLTGAGYFKETVLYYGFYTNSTIRKIEDTGPYYMQLAYIFTTGIYFIICFFSLLYSMAKSFRKNFVNPQMYSGHAAKLLCAWDFNITNEKAVTLKQRNFSTQIKETLSDVKLEALKRPVSQKMASLAIHLAAWVVSSGTAVACCAGVYFLSINNLDLFLRGGKTELENQAATLVLPIVVCVLNLAVPFFYSVFGLVEKFKYPRHQIYTTMIRNILLKISVIGILCFYWLNIVATSGVECWESLVGQDIYRLVIVDFLFCLLGSFFGEFVRRIIGTKCCKTLGVPEFDIARNVLDLIYTQTLAWIGIFFSPLLPAIQLISLLIIFYVKKVSLMMNCQPPHKAWRASQMNTVFIFLLFFPSFAGVLSIMAITVWRLKPSENCGPFQGLTSPYDAISRWIDILTSYPSSIWVVWIYRNLIESVHFYFILSIIVLIISYLYWQIIEGRKIMVRLLHEQIINEGKDKMFLLNKLRMLQGSRSPKAGGQQERNLSVSQPPRQQALQTPDSDYPERLSERNERVSYAEPHYSGGVAEMTSFSQDPGGRQPSARGGTSEALALALRARDQAEWEMEEEDFSS
uniref:Transmembrane channel-like protein n=1 Tax=Sphenodon punctatus TaxID=8508 RepID=A0A8D0GPY7_SPHPU